jgi:hypothetical protein
MISTKIFGRHKEDWTQARTGGFFRSTHSFQTELWSSKSFQSANHTLAVRSFDLSVPRLLQKTVDGFKHLLGLNAHITGWLGRHATSTDDPVVDYDKTD